jgi:Flp pilus assembly protein TadG
MTPRHHVRSTRDRGSLSVVLMLMVVIALAGGALIVDGGRALAARRHAANTAEAAARFAVSSQSLSTEIDATTAREAALSYASRAGVPASDVAVDIRVDDEGQPTVFVTITERRTSVFLILGGRDQITVRATGAARFTYTT